LIDLRGFHKLIYVVLCYETILIFFRTLYDLFLRLTTG